MSRFQLFKSLIAYHIIKINISTKHSLFCIYPHPIGVLFLSTNVKDQVNRKIPFSVAFQIFLGMLEVLFGYGRLESVSSLRDMLIQLDRSGLPKF